MHAEFEAIDRYLVMSRSISQEEMDSEMLTIDQKVPQTLSLKSEDDVMFSLAMGAFPPLDPIPNVGCIQVSESNDQQVHGADSPKSFVDLDNIHGADVSFYSDEQVFIKNEEKQFNDCSMQGSYPCQNQEIVSIDQEIEENDVEFAIIQYQMKEIDHVCNILSIHHDPKQWTVEDARKWIVWHGREFNEPHINVDLFHMTGADLCLLTPEEFRCRTSVAGPDLYSQLYVWKNVSACRIESSVYSHSVVTAQPTIPQPSLSPCPSTASDDSSSSSSNLSYLPVYNSDDEYQPYSRPGCEKMPGESEHKQIKLWEFLKELLLHPESNSNCIKWINRDDGIFKIEDSVRVAKLWGRRKNRPNMNYDKLSRSIRQYYRKGIIKKTQHSKRLVYQFCKPCL